MLLVAVVIRQLPDERGSAINHPSRCNYRDGASAFRELFNDFLELRTKHMYLSAYQIATLRDI